MKYGRRPNFSKVEDDLNFFKMEDDQNKIKMEDNLIFFQNGRRHNSFSIWKTTERRPTFFQIRQPKTIKIKTIVVAPLRLT